VALKGVLLSQTFTIGLALGSALLSVASAFVACVARGKYGPSEASWRALFLRDPVAVWQRARLDWRRAGLDPHGATQLGRLSIIDE
jgi:hypothetical protein